MYERGDEGLLRTSTFRLDRWGDKIMSVLRVQQLEACQDRLSRCPEEGIFDNVCYNQAQLLFQLSFYQKELHPRKPLCISQMHQLMLSQLPQEACFLSPREDALVKRMLMDNGETCISDWDEISAAEALVSRLWCTLQIPQEDTALLRLQEPLIAPLMKAMQSPLYARVRERLFSFDATLHSLLYLSGFLHASVPMTHFCQALGADADKHTPVLISRYLRAAFDYTETQSGEILLLHPGLADPELLFSRLACLEAPETHLTREMMLGGMNGILPEEVASCEAMRGALCGAVRPDLEEDEALDDLRMMAKQGASLQEMREVLESMLCVMPTPRMLDALSQLHLQAVRWIGMPSAVLN